MKYDLLWISLSCMRHFHIHNKALVTASPLDNPSFFEALGRHRQESWIKRVLSKKTNLQTTYLKLHSGTVPCIHRHTSITEGCIYSHGPSQVIHQLCKWQYPLAAYMLIPSEHPCTQASQTLTDFFAKILLTFQKLSVIRMQHWTLK